MNKSITPPKQRLFVDMDGTLATFIPTKNLEDLYQRGYFLNLPPIINAVEAIKMITQSEDELEVFILSAVLPDSIFAKDEKNIWLNHYLPEVDLQHRIFSECGQQKSSYIPGGINTNDFLLDDYTKNLIEWEKAGGSGIKILNGINHTNATWQKQIVHSARAPVFLADCILSIMSGTNIIDNLKTFFLGKRPICTYTEQNSNLHARKNAAFPQPAAVIKQAELTVLKEQFDPPSF